jgi:hypothetical protein
MTFDPFMPPTSSLDPPEVPTEDRFREVPASVVAILAATRPWLRLLVGFFVAGIALMALAILGLAMAQPGGARLGTLVTMLIPVLMVIIVNGAPMILVSRYARAIRRLELGGGLPALEDALANQKGFWKYVGILVLVLVPLYAMIIIATRSRFLGR